MKTTVSRWGVYGARPEPLAQNDALFGAFEARGNVEVACDPWHAWDLITNVRRIGEFSPECIGANWLHGSSGPSVGAQFEGTNRVINEDGKSEYIWIRPCTIVIARPPERFQYTVGDRYDGTPATLWDFHIEPTSVGCRITEEFRHLPSGLSGIRHEADAKPSEASMIVKARTQHLAKGITQTLERMKHVLEAAC